MSDVAAVSMRVLAAAMEMEKKGKAFYQEAASQCGNNLGREIFRLLGEYEDRHLDRIQEIYRSLEKGAGWLSDWNEPGPDTDVAKIFHRLAREQAGSLKVSAGEIEALDIGQKLESSSIDFYENRLKSSGDALEKAFLQSLILEEKEHFRILADLRYYYQDPGGWLMEKERSGLDGV